MFMFLVSTTTTYKHLGTGYCSDYAYLPKGTPSQPNYPHRLEPGHASHDADPIQECLNRCMAASVGGTVGNEAFYLNSAKKCACAKGDCSALKGSGYDAYQIIQGKRWV